MKFVLVTVAFFAVILRVQSAFYPASALGLGLNGVGLGLNPLGLAPVGLGLNGLSLALGGINGLGLNSLGLLNLNNLGLGHHHHRADLGVAYGQGIPGQSLSQGPAILTGPAAHVDVSNRGIIAHGGLGATYVAKTRGAIHTAPLDGHINSAASVNIAPAPGTL